VAENEMERVLDLAATPEQWLYGLENALLAQASADHDNYSAIAVACG